LEPSDDRERWLVVAAAVLIVGAFFAGRYSNPTSTVERVRVQLVEKQVVVVQEKVRVETVTVEKTTHQLRVVEREVVKPDGSIERTRETQAAAHTDARVTTDESLDRQGSSVVEKSGSTDSARAVTYALPRWRVGVTAGVAPFEAWRPVYGGEAGLRVVGPFWVGVGADSGGVLRASVAIEF